MTAKLIPLKPRAVAPLKQPQKSSRVRRAYQRQTAAAVALASISLALTALSLSHLAHGVMIVTAAPAIEAWAMAIGIDLLFIGLEVAQLCICSQRARKTFDRFGPLTIKATLALSAAMNAFAFGAGAQGLFVIAAVALGLLIPVLIYVGTRVSTSLLINRGA